MFIQFRDGDNDSKIVNVNDIKILDLHTNAQTCDVYVRNNIAPNESVSDHVITVTTTTGNAETFAVELADKIAASKIGGANCLIIKASGDGISSVVSTVAYTAGS
tara:strand:+ start:349 stop:663 length:315 start_codon:yes stop_codon:yes gene_type:complete